MDFIFEQFTKLSHLNKYQNFKGVGLGLYASRQVAIQLGGNIEVQSRMDEGSIFTFTLPLQDKSGLKVPLPLQE
ncbi:MULTISPECIES: sensor histidine kinase [Legionella]|uniref:sensor histidine kinase n=1 Tax=Legionella TaxID=445 RepID=UPI00338EECC3